MEHQATSTFSANTSPISVLSTSQDDTAASAAVLEGQFSGLAVKPVVPSPIGPGSLAANETSHFPGGSDIHVTGLEKREIKTEFKPFPSIEDCKKKSYIDRMFKLDPELSEARYVVSEKLDGANFTVMINEDIRYFSRNREVRAENPFFDAPTTFKKYQEDFQKIQSALGSMKCESFTLRGEYFGAGINRRIGYGEKKFAPFIIEKNGKPQTHQQFRAFMEGMQFTELKPVPLLLTDVSFEEALAFDPENLVTRARTDTQAPTTQAVASAPPTVHDFIEGVVIQPCNYLIKGERPFLLKKRAKQYLEIERKGDRIGKSNQKGAQASQPDTKTDDNAFSHFSDYVTENRLINVISHHGELTSKEKLGFYINKMIQDAKKDYCKDYPEATMEDRLPKPVNKSAKTKIVAILQRKYPDLFQKKDAK